MTSNNPKQEIKELYLIRMYKNAIRERINDLLNREITKEILLDEIMATLIKESR